MFSLDDNLFINSDDKMRGSKDSLIVLNYNLFFRYGYFLLNGILNVLLLVGYLSFMFDGFCGMIELIVLVSSLVFLLIEVILVLFKFKML